MFKTKKTLITALILFISALTGCTFNITNNFTLPKEEKHFNLELFNDCKSEIYGYQVEYYLDGKLIGGMGKNYADEGKLNDKDAFRVTLYESHFPKDSDLSGFQFQISVLDKEMKQSEPTEILSLSAEYGKSYNIRISGSFENGFSEVKE